MGLKHTLLPGIEGLGNVLQRPSSWVLIVVNLGLIAGAVAWNWQVFDIVFLYWVENLVIGIINVLKMLTANGKNLPGIAKLTSTSAADKAKIKQFQAMAGMGNTIKFFLVPFFIIHYGGFCFGHGVFIFSMFSDGGMTLALQDVIVERGILTTSMLFAISLLAASHLYSFFRNFIGAGEYRKTHSVTLMMRPYGRIVTLHIAIIFGAFLNIAFGSPLGLLIILMLLKTLVDLVMHNRERQKLQAL